MWYVNSFESFSNISSFIHSIAKRYDKIEILENLGINQIMIPQNTYFILCLCQIFLPDNTVFLLMVLDIK